MDDLEKYLSKQRLIGFIIAVIGIAALLVSLIMFLVYKPNNNYIWWLIAPIIITSGFSLLGLGWMYMYNKQLKLYRKGNK